VACGSGGSAVSGPAPASTTVNGSFSGTDTEAQLLARALVEKSHAIADVKEAAVEQTAMQQEATATVSEAQAGVEEKRRSVGSRSSFSSGRLSGSSFSSFGGSSFGSTTIINNSVRTFSPPVFIPSPVFFPPSPVFVNPVFPSVAVGVPIFGVSPAFWSFNIGFGPSFIPGPRFVGAVNYTFVQPPNVVVPSPGLPTEPITFGFDGVDIVVADGTTTITGGTVQVNGGLLPGFRLGFDRWRITGEALVAGSSAILTNSVGQQVTILVVSSDPTRALLRVTYGANTPVPGTSRLISATRQPDGRIAYALA
jgi:hypothetical protein